METILIVLTFFILGCRATINNTVEEPKYNCSAYIPATNLYGGHKWSQCNCTLDHHGTEAICEDGYTYHGVPITYSKE